MVDFAANFTVHATNSCFYLFKNRIKEFSAL